jgi:hypothetical protein
MTAFDDFLSDLRDAFAADKAYTSAQVTEVVDYIRDQAPAFAFGIEAGGAHVAVRTDLHAGGEVDFDAAGNMIAARLTDCSQVHLV